MNVMTRQEIRNQVTQTLKRAAGQRGRSELRIKLETIDSQLGNAGTLFEIEWEVLDSGQLELVLFVDGVSVWKSAA